MRRKVLQKWWVLLVVAAVLLLLPLSVGAVTNPDALDGLQVTLVQEVEALRITLKALVETYQAYLTAL